MKTFTNTQLNELSLKLNTAIKSGNASDAKTENAGLALTRAILISLATVEILEDTPESRKKLEGEKVSAYDMYRLQLMDLMSPLKIEATGYSGGMGATAIKLLEKLKTALEKYPKVLQEVFTTTTQVGGYDVTPRFNAMHSNPLSPEFDGTGLKSMAKFSQVLDLVLKIGKGTLLDATVAAKNELMTSANVKATYKTSGLTKAFNNWVLQLDPVVNADIMKKLKSFKEKQTGVTNPSKIVTQAFKNMAVEAKKANSNFKRFEGLEYFDAQLRALEKSKVIWAENVLKEIIGKMEIKTTRPFESFESFAHAVEGYRASCTSFREEDKMKVYAECDAYTKAVEIAGKVDASIRERIENEWNATQAPEVVVDM